MRLRPRISAVPFALAILLAAASTRDAIAQGSSTLTLLGRMDRYPGYAGIWGYVDAEGREYALIGTRVGTSIVDVTDPANLIEVASISGPPSGWREIQTYSTYAYVTTEGGGGVQIIDLSDLPRSASLARTYSLTVSNAHTLFVDQGGGRAYINGAGPPSTSRGGMNILDLSDPRSPVEVGVYSDRYVHDSYVRNDIAYTAEIGSRQFSVVDVSDPANPRVLAQRPYPGAAPHNAWLTDDGAYLLTTDETIVPGGRMRVWDIGNLEAIVQVGEYTTHPQATIHNIYAFGDFACGAYYAEGVRIVDMTDPTLPVEAGFYDTLPEWVDGYRGVWGCYPFLPSGRILASDMQTGLWVFSFDGTYAGRLRGVIRDAGTQDPIEGATVAIVGHNAPVASNASGEYGIGFLPDLSRVIVSKPGYETVEMDVTLVSGKTLLVDVELAAAESCLGCNVR